MTHNLNYIIALSIFIVALYAIISSQNLIKKLLALGMLQMSVLLFFISLGKIIGGKVPILKCLDFVKCPEIYNNPVPHTLMLTAIVVGLSTLSVGLAIIIKIRQEIGSINEDEIIIKSS